MPHTLLLVPTPQERDLMLPQVAAGLDGAVRLELCGFGLVAAAARTAHLLAANRPTSVLLVGIAGRLDDRLSIGSAYRFDEVACHGVGVGSGAGFLPAGQLGWRQWPGEPEAKDYSGDRAGAASGDVIACSPSPGPGSAGLLLSVCAASATADDLHQRLRLFPDAVAEDMEGFAVALACRLQGVPLRIVRGISNTAGDRAKEHWQIPAAIAAAADLTLRILEEGS
jgi:futalosine hydrolase